jgi:hypothetical protein
VNKLTLVLAGSLSVVSGGEAFASTAPSTWDGMTTAAAMGYCLAKHPYQSVYTGFAPDGYEVASYPGVVGTTRRNFVLNRTAISTPPAPGDTDEGVANSCPAACKQWGINGGPNFRGVALRQKLAGGAIMPSGIGDLAHQATFDVNFYTWVWEVAAMYSTSNNWHLSDVAQADYCCCQMVPMQN